MVLEDPPGVLDQLGVVQFGLGQDRDVPDREAREDGPRREALNARIEALRQQSGRFQDRENEIVRLDRNQNGSHAHALQGPSPAADAVRAGASLPRFKPSGRALPGPSGGFARARSVYAPRRRAANSGTS